MRISPGSLRGWVTLVVSLGTVASLTAASVEPPSGLVGWWPGDGDALNRVGPPGTIAGGASFAAGRVGQAFQLSGAGQAVVTQLDSQPSTLPTVTWEAWVFPTTVNFGIRQQILSTDDGGYDRSVLIESGTSNFGVFTGSGVWQPTSVTPNAWQHVAVVFRPNGITFFKDGQAFEYGQSPVGQASGNRLQIGANPGYGEFFRGLIDEVSVYNRALTTGEIQGIVAAGAEGKTKTPPGSADLRVTSSISPDPASLPGGDRLTNVVEITNLGPDPARFVALSLPVPPGVTPVGSEISSGTATTSATVVNAAVDSIPVLGKVALRVILKPVLLGPVTLTATVAGVSNDPNPANNSGSATATIAGNVTSTDGDWGAANVILSNTPEAGLMVRVGDIDNLGFGWPAGFDPFGGGTTPPHAFPFSPSKTDPAGTDRILVPSSYNGNPPRGQDGYVNSSSRPGNLPQPIVLTYNLAGRFVTSAALQLFVDDFQASWGPSYRVTLNGQRAPFLEDLINALQQTGPVGKLLTTAIPAEFLPLVQSGQLSLLIDDPVTGAGDGFAIDFVKLLINVKGFGQSGVIQGTVTDAETRQPIAGARVAAQQATATITDSQGRFVLNGVAAGLVSVVASAADYASVTRSTDLAAGQTVTLDFALTLQPLLRIEAIPNDQVRISWPNRLAGYALQMVPTTLAPASWAAEGSTPVIVDGRFTVTNAASGSARFYRLAK